MKIVTRQQFLDWLKTKSASQPACLDDTGNCPMANYAMEVLGAASPEAGSCGVYDDDNNPIFEFADGLRFHHFKGAKTYGEVIRKIER